MTRVLEWATIQMNRRRFIARAAGATFGALAGAAVGVPNLAYAGACTGPYGTGYCSSTNCTAGGRCRNYCSSTACCCYGRASGCWTSGAHTCCDCACYRPPTGSYFCVCHG
jgi:hypothetical protein